MAIVNFKNEVHPIKVGDETKYAPVIQLEGKHAFISHQDSILYFDTKEEAEEYFNED